MTQATNDLAAVLDRHEILGLVHAYCRLCDVADGVGVAALFTEDCRYDHGPGDGATVHGRERLSALLTQMLDEFAHTSHHSSNEEIHLDGPDRAHGISYILGWHEYRDERPNGVAFGQYEDVFVRTEQGWRIAERKVLAHGHENFNYDMHWIARRPIESVAT